MNNNNSSTKNPKSKEEWIDLIDNNLVTDEDIDEIIENQRIVKQVTEFIRGQKLTDRVSVDVIDSIIFPRSNQ